MDSKVSYSTIKDLPRVERPREKLIRYGPGKLSNSELLAILLGTGTSEERLLNDKQAQIYLSAKEVYQELRELRSHRQEHFVTFFLDSRNQEIKREVITVGTLTANLVHPREIFEPAIYHNSAQVIISHNHPSGDPQPSNEDIQTTERLVKAGKILGIQLLDYVIIAKQGYFSFREDTALIGEQRE